jgi:rRNA maturation protein Rpf1
MNIYLPGGIETSQAAGFYDFIPLILVLVASGIPALIMFLYFRRLGWVGTE